MLAVLVDDDKTLLTMPDKVSMQHRHLYLLMEKWRSSSALCERACDVWGKDGVYVVCIINDSDCRM